MAVPEVWPQLAGTMERGSVAAIEALGNCQGGPGLLWRPVWRVAAAILDMGCSVGVSYSDHTPLQGPVTAAWWQQAGGSVEGGVAGRDTKRRTLGG